LGVGKKVEIGTSVGLIRKNRKSVFRAILSPATCLLTSIFLLLLTGCSPKQQLPGTADSKVLFTLHDSSYDDRGSGTYVYPISLEERDGIFDLKSLTVRDLGSLFEFEVVFLRPLDREGIDGERYQKGWVHQLIDIYLDLDGIPGSGHTFSLPGRNVVFSRDEAWDKVIVLTPGPSRVIEDHLTNLSEQRILFESRNDVLVPDDLFIKTFSLVARVSKAKIGPMPRTPGVQVCILGYEPDHLSRRGMLNSEVLRFATEVSFGGGTEAQGESNILDILAPDRKSQYEVLSAYRSGPYDRENVHPILPLIYPKSKQNEPKFRRKSTNRGKKATKPLIDDRYMLPAESTK